MKKIVKSYCEIIKPVKLYLDDLTEIVEILKGACEEVCIQIEDVQLDDLDEISSLRKEVIFDISVRGYEPYVSVEMKPHTIHLYIQEDTPESRGLLEKVKTVLLRCRRFTLFLDNAPYIFGTLLGFSIGIFVILKERPMVFGILNLALFMAVVLSFKFVFNEKLKHYTTVVLKYKIETPGFFKRNKDRILLALISASIGAIVTYILTLL